MKPFLLVCLVAGASIVAGACSSSDPASDAPPGSSSGAPPGSPGSSSGAPPDEVDAGQPGAKKPGRPGDPALPAPPKVPSKECTINLAAHGIANDGTQPDATTDGINAAIKALVADGCGRIKLPAGTYAIGKKTSDHYYAGIILQSGMILVMDDAAVLKLRPTDTWAYCVVEISGKHDVGITGGSVLGDRDEHTYKSADKNKDEAHAICVQDESERVAIDRVKIGKAVGDGVLIVAQGATGSSCKDVSITNSELFENRRQGVSIVGGVRVLIENNEIHHTEGTAPQFGVDIESLTYKSEDITIRDNRFHHNKGGDVVNTDGRKVLIEANTMQDGEGNQYIDGPIIFWSNTDQTIRGNDITMRKGSANGTMGILEYSHKAPRTNLTRTIIEENELHDCSIDVMYDSLITIRKNTVRGKGKAIIALEVKDLEIVDNVLENGGGRAYSYMLHKCTGTASGNILNGEPYDMAMTPDEPFSTWDGN